MKLRKILAYALCMCLIFGTLSFSATAADSIATIGEVSFESIQAAVDAATDGDVIHVVSNVSDEAVSVDKSVTITGDVTLENVSIDAVGECKTLTVSGLSFVGNSWINCGVAGKLVVSGVQADVKPINTDKTNSRSAFISLGRSEQHALELVVENCSIVSGSGNTNVILGWAAITSASITGNTFGTEEFVQKNSDSVKIMAIAEGAVLNIVGNTVYSDYNGFVFGQNTTRDNAYSVNVKNNTFVGSADHVWVEVTGSNTTHAKVNATSDNTINGATFTTDDIKVHPSVTTWTGYAGVDVVLDQSGKIISGTFIDASNVKEHLAEDATFDAETGTVVSESYVAEVDGVGYKSLSEAIKALKAGSVLNLLKDETITTNWDCRDYGKTACYGTIRVPATINGNGHTLKFTGEINDGGNHHSVFRFEADVTVNNLTIDTSEASTSNNRIRAISSKGDLTIDGCTFIGNSAYTNTRGIIFGEGAGAAISDIEISITNSVFTDWRKGLGDNENAQDVKTIVANGNTFTNASVALSASDSIEFSNNTMEDAWVNIKSYAPVNELSVVAKGNTLEEDEGSNYNYFEAIDLDTDAEDVNTAAALLNGKLYQTLGSAVEKAADGDVVYVYPGTYDAISVTKSITITGDPAYGADAALMAVTEKPVINIKEVADGGVKYQAPNVTFDNIVFNVAADATRTGGYYAAALGYFVEDNATRNTLTLTNCDFINNSTVPGLIAVMAHIPNYSATGCSFVNFDTGFSTMLDGSALGTVNVSNNTFANVRELYTGYWGKVGTPASITVANNVATDNSSTLINVYDYVKETVGTEATAFKNVNVTNNNATVVLTNYAEGEYAIDVANNDDVVYTYKSEDMITSLGDAVPEGTVYVNYGRDNQQAYVINADGTIVTAEKVELVFVKNTDDPEALDNSVWDLVLRSADDELINRLNSADFTFSLTSTDDMDYEIVETNDEIEINNVNNLKDRYEFHFKNKDNVADTATEITIGQVRFTGYGPFLFLVDDADTNAVHATTLKDNIVASYAVNSLIVNSESENLDGDDVFGTVDTTIEVPTKDLTVNIAFPNAVENKEIAYQDMKVVVSGDDLAPVTVDLGSDAGQTDILGVNNRPDAMFTVSFRDGGYVVNFLDALTVNTSYDITVSGAGYRTARYTVRMTDNKTVNFWNNVKDADAYMEVSDLGNKAPAKLNYLAGDIVKDNKINTYDLSAVVSY
ncbi:MAG: hypothetical protein IJC78_02600, partial [Clostridia bacterium]|nr:hypothetical protein [Clostridia bacterium]